MEKQYLIVLALFYILLQTAAANPITTVLCPIMDDIQFALETIGGTLVMIMFVYGGLKYVFSADDPGGRKQGKMTCIHAVIGGIIVVLADNIVPLIGASACP